MSYLERKLVITRADNTTVTLQDPTKIVWKEEIGLAGELYYEEWDPEGTFAREISNGDLFDLYLWFGATPVKYKSGRIISVDYDDEDLIIKGIGYTGDLIGVSILVRYDAGTDHGFIIRDLISKYQTNLNTNYLLNTNTAIEGKFDKNHEDLFEAIWELLDDLNYNMYIDLNKEVMIYPNDKSLLLLDGFNKTTASDGSSWSIISGTWSIEDGEYSTSGIGTEIATIGSPTWKDYELRLLFKRISGTNLGCIVRYTDANNYYLITIEDSTLKLSKVVAGVTTTLRSVTITIADNIQYDLRVKIQGSTILVYFEKELRISQTDSDITSGYIGLRTVDTHCHYDNIMIYGLDKTSYVDGDLYYYGERKDISQIENRVIVIGGQDETGKQIIALAEDPVLIEKYGLKQSAPIYDTAINTNEEARRIAEVELARRKIEALTLPIEPEFTTDQKIGDLVDLTISRYGITNREYVIIGITQEIKEEWKTILTLSERIPEILEYLVEMKKALRRESVRDLTVKAQIFRVYQPISLNDKTTLTTQTTGTFVVGTARVGFSDVA